MWSGADTRIIFRFLHGSAWSYYLLNDCQCPVCVGNGIVTGVKRAVCRILRRDLIRTRIGCRIRASAGQGDAADGLIIFQVICCELCTVEG